MLLHVFLLSVIALWMSKIAESNQLNKSKCVLWGVIGYVVFSIGIHYSLFIFGEEIYDNHRLISAINIVSGMIGALIVNIIIYQKGKKIKRLKE